MVTAKVSRVISVNCPACGRGVAFRSEFSSYSVCESCDSLLVRQDAEVGLLGKVTEIQPDGSLLQIGTQGLDQGRAFEIIGRIQLAYEDGFWNEWYLHYSDGSGGWLGEAMGEFFLSVSHGPQPEFADVDRLKPGFAVSLGGERYVVTTRTESRLSTFEGELPFLVETDEPFFSIDLRSGSTQAATIDYSESPPLLFLGRYCEFDEFQFTGLRTGSEVEVEAGGSARAAGVEKLSCPTCGAPHSIAGGVRSKVLGCEFCGSTIDLTNSNYSVLHREHSTRERLRRGVELEIGSQAEIDGAEFILLGYLKKTVTYEGVDYPWVEYLLYSPKRGYRWLECSDGHYTLMHNLDRLPLRANSPVGWPNTSPINFEDRHYRHFQSARATVRGLGGELYWRVRVGESVVNHVYVSPPYLLACETSDYGQVWVQGEYLEPERVQRMFGLKKHLAAPVGVAPNQPNKNLDKALAKGKLAALFLLVALVLTVVSPSSGGRTVYQVQSQPFETFRPTITQETEPFTISGRGNLAFSFEVAALKNRWVHFDTELLDENGKVVRRVGRSVSRFHSQGSNRETVRVRGVPNGTYSLRYRLTSGSSKLPDQVNLSKKSISLRYSIQLQRGVRVWGWFWALSIALLIAPVLHYVAASTLETMRWYSSDHS